MQSVNSPISRSRMPKTAASRCFTTISRTRRRIILRITQRRISAIAWKSQAGQKPRGCHEHTSSHTHASGVLVLCCICVLVSHSHPFNHAIMCPQPPSFLNPQPTKFMLGVQIRMMAADILFHSLHGFPASHLRPLLALKRRNPVALSLPNQNTGIKKFGIKCFQTASQVPNPRCGAWGRMRFTGRSGEGPVQR